ncbi:MAG: TIR domain-containing protein [Pseudomonadota bacterium]
MAKFFINYRREDSEGKTFSLRQELLKHFKEDELFMDIKGMEPGKDFEVQIIESVSACDAMLVVIGTSWVEIKDKDGNRRLEEDSDFVRSEIRNAINLRKPIIPVLLDGTKMPPAERLPEDIRQLVKFPAMQFTIEHIEANTQRIANAMKEVLPQPTASRRLLAGVAIGAGVGGLLLGAFATPFVAQMAGYDDLSPISLKRQLDNSLAALSNIENQLDLANNQNLLHQRDLNVLQRNLGKAEQDIKAAEIENRRLSAALLLEGQKLVEKSETYVEEVEELHAELTVVRQELTKESDALSAAQADIEQKLKEISAFESALDASTRQVLKKQAELKELRVKLADTSSRLTETEDKLANLTESESTEVFEMRQAIAKANDEKTGLLEKLAALGAAVQNLEADRDELLKRAIEADGTIKTVCDMWPKISIVGELAAIEQIKVGLRKSCPYTEIE